ncbi:hypothetical protein [Candidatus Mycobacterium methanotrophicum]|uniref:Uncharacterized protein n=1 Tax=Candidatus Mycobacterium methanotrophicum TaxID=2943498 RepID=A0ABY4QU77_9MYCO|nr:hypothetical protein [Candidatus Mycobacterium methanotrophicum]UQX13569.1 hypothetical protein M5I08_25600 [Candidatus Mycobacterium methanotrophicum]
MTGVAESANVDCLVGQAVRVLATGEVGDVTEVVRFTDTGQSLCRVQWWAPDDKTPGRQRQITAYCYPNHLELVQDCAGRS